jgi:pSer/pThr/pTyr-binding forkhead associated (FHA) protein
VRVGVTLHCTGGPLSGESVTVDGELVLGRDQPEPGRLRGDPRLSRRHARIFIDDAGRPMVEDLGSTNGTRLNGERLTAARLLATGDELQVGQSTFDVQVAQAARATAPDSGVPAVTPTVREATASAARLLVLAGPKLGEEIPLGDELLIGRGYGEPGALGGDRLLSRSHARIARGPGGVFFLQDTGSTNGTMLNGVALRRVQALKDGDQIEIGSTRLEARGLPAAPLDAGAAGAPGFDPWPAGRAAGAVPAGAAPGGGAPAAAPGGAGPAGPPFLGAVAAAAPGPGPEYPAVSQFMPRGAAGTRLSSRRVIGVFVGVFATAAIVAGLVVVLAAPLGSRNCPQGFVCHKPPTAPPLRALATFTGGLHWRVEYDSQMATPASTSGNQIILRESDAQDKLWGASPGSQIINVELRASPSNQTSPQAAMQSLASGIASKLVGAETAPTSDQMFGQPVLGFHPAQGEVLEGSQQTPQGPGGLIKVAVLSASSGGVTIAAAVVFPVQKGQSQQDNPDRPLDQFGDQILETVRFPNDGAT